MDRRKGRDILKENEGLRRRLPSWVALAVAGLYVAVYVFTIMYDGGGEDGRYLGLVPSPDFHFTLLRLGGKSNPLIAGGEIWRLVTAMFLHAGLLHLSVNAAGVYFLGRLSFSALGYRRTIVVFFLAGLAGNVASFQFSDALSVGASGGLFGLIGAFSVYLLRIRRWLPPRARWVILIGLPLWGVLNVLVGFVWPDIDNAAHIGGLVAGVIVGFAFPTRRKPGPALNALVLLAIVSIVASGAATLRSAYRPLPEAAPPLVTLRSLGEGEGPVTGNFVPSTWQMGRFVERRCHIEQDRAAENRSAPWCFVDPYESLLVVGAVDAIFDKENEFVQEFRQKADPLGLFRQDSPGETLFVWPVDDNHAYVLACHPLAVARYEPLVERLRRSLWPR